MQSTNKQTICFDSSGLCLTLIIDNYKRLRKDEFKVVLTVDDILTFYAYDYAGVDIIMQSANLCGEYLSFLIL